MAVMKHLHKTFWARQIALGLYGFLAITIFILHDIEETYSAMNTNINMVMEMRLADEIVTDIAFIKPVKKPVKGQFDLASVQ
jgi:hypothetical protein